MGTSPHYTTHSECMSFPDPAYSPNEPPIPPSDHFGDFQVTDSNNAIVYGCSTKITPFETDPDIQLQMKDHVFISKECTRKLGLYIVRENWDYQCGLLYNYLDYIFRCQVFQRQIIKIDDNGKQSLVFHSGLQRRSDHQLLYVLLIPNKKDVTQKWRVSFGNIKNSFLSKQELLAKYSEAYVVEHWLPKRTKFTNCLSDLLYDDTFQIEVNWETRLITNKDRISKVMGNMAFFSATRKFLKLKELIPAFEYALKTTQRIARLNPRLAVAQGFVDSKRCRFRMELLLPCVVEFPKYSKKHYTFAISVTKKMTEPNAKKYSVKSILTLDMAYANARLIGYVDSSWLHFKGRQPENDWLCKTPCSGCQNKCPFFE